MDRNDIDEIWRPRLHIRGIKKATQLAEGVDNEFSGHSLTPNEETRIYMTFERSLVIGCPLDFAGFPFDVHYCYYEV